MAIKNPIRFIVDNFSLKISRPIKAELTTILILNIGKKTELSK